MKRLSRTTVALHRSQAGAAAVEFALIVPVLLLFVVGIFEFGRAYSAQISLAAASREGARVMAVTADASAARQATVDAATALSPPLTTSQVAIAPGSCTPGATVSVTATYPLNTMTGFFGSSFTLSGKGVMRCGG